MLMYNNPDRFSIALFFALLLHVAAAVLLSPVVSRSNNNESPQVFSVTMSKIEQPALSEAAQSQPEPLPQQSEPIRPRLHQSRQQPSIMVVNDSISTMSAEVVSEPAQTNIQPSVQETVAAADVAASNPSAMDTSSMDTTLQSTVASLVSPQFNADYLSNPAPEYPAKSRVQREEGVVLLRVYVATDGHPEQITLYRSSGFTLLDYASEEAVWRWKFIPGRQDGRVVAAWVIVPVRFSLRK
jgi:periplasmic protein TonB